MNTSDTDRRMLLIEIAAADAWPLLPPTQDVGEIQETMLMGDWRMCLVPRMEACPVALPLPRNTAGSIYATQSLLKNKAFGEEGAEVEATTPAKGVNNRGELE